MSKIQESTKRGKSMKSSAAILASKGFDWDTIKEVIDQIFDK